MLGLFGRNTNRSNDKNVKNALHSTESMSAVDITALKSPPPPPLKDNAASTNTISKTGLYVLILLAFQNCSKNLLLRFVMKEHPKFLTSAAVIGIESVKLLLCLLYISFIDKQPLYTVVIFMKRDQKNTILMGVPAALYSIQMTLEYIALANLDAAVFSVLVQTKLLATAGCAVLILRKKIKEDYTRNTTANNSGGSSRRLAETDGEEDTTMDTTKGIIATLCISACSGFASVYTEKVIKAKRSITTTRVKSEDEDEEKLAMVQKNANGEDVTQQQQQQKQEYGLEIMEKGLWYGFNAPAYVSILVSALGGLTVAADAVLKGYATAISVILTGMSSMVLFGTKLNVLYFLGIGNVICAVLLYSSTDLDQLLC
eukprot:scaffold31011_cov47-Cyclotella_meneghiniana.AAC.3